jgi:hypothetical protein
MKYGKPSEAGHSCQLTYNKDIFVGWVFFDPRPNSRFDGVGGDIQSIGGLTRVPPITRLMEDHVYTSVSYSSSYTIHLLFPAVIPPRVWREGEWPLKLQQGSMCAAESLSTSRPSPACLYPLTTAGSRFPPCRLFNEIAALGYLAGNSSGRWNRNTTSLILEDPSDQCPRVVRNLLLSILQSNINS